MELKDINRTTKSSDTFKTPFFILKITLFFMKSKYEPSKSQIPESPKWY
jgi:hypothetical protein